VIAADLFTAFEQNRQLLTFGDVQRHLSQLGSHPRDCTCGRCPLVSRVTPHRVYLIASGWQRRVHATRLRTLR
jgi:hypothetical protein